MVHYFYLLNPTKKKKIEVCQKGEEKWTKIVLVAQKYTLFINNPYHFQLKSYFWSAYKTHFFKFFTY